MSPATSAVASCDPAEAYVPDDGSLPGVGGVTTRKVLGPGPAMLAVLFIAVAVVVVGNRIIGPHNDQLLLSQESTGSADAAAANGALSKAEMDALVWQEFERLMAGEWTRYGGGSPGVPGAEVPAQGWIRFSPGSSPWDHLREAYEKGVPVYDRPDGEILGYEFASLGFVPREIAEAPGFDPQAARQQKFGCDTQDAQCVASVVGQPSGQ